MLRKVIALGGQAGSAELRDWATRELRGYGADDEIPEYRKVGAPLQIDGSNIRFAIRGQTISSWHMPEIARDTITTDVTLPMGRRGFVRAPAVRRSQAATRARRISRAAPRT